MFRRLAIERPALYSIGVQRDLPATSLPWQASATPPTPRSPCSSSASRGSTPPGCLGDQTVIEATLQFHALCEGLATLERRGTRTPFDAERVWRAGLGALIAGFATAAPAPRTGLGL